MAEALAYFSKHKVHLILQRKRFSYQLVSQWLGPQLQANCTGYLMESHKKKKKFQKVCRDYCNLSSIHLFAIGYSIVLVISWLFSGYIPIKKSRLLIAIVILQLSHRPKATLSLFVDKFLFNGNFRVCRWQQYATDGRRFTIPADLSQLVAILWQLDCI